MGKINVTMLRYLSKEDFRVLTAVSVLHFVRNIDRLMLIFASVKTLKGLFKKFQVFPLAHLIIVLLFRLKWE